MHISGGEFKNGSCDVQCNWDKDKGVKIKFETNVDVKCVDLESIAGGDDSL